MPPWWDDTEPDDDYEERRAINAGELARHRGERHCHDCGCDDDFDFACECPCHGRTFDNDELGLDPEEG